MDRIKSLSRDVLDSHKSKFGEDFTDNKKALDEVSIIRSKGLKNEMAGYITKFIKKEIRDEKAKQLQIEQSKQEIPQETNIEETEMVSEAVLSETISPEAAPTETTTPEPTPEPAEQTHTENIESPEKTE